jgi:hypothetical protein
LRRLQQHSHVGLRQAGKSEKSDCGTRDKHIQIMNGNWDLTELAIFSASHKQNVKAFTQFNLKSLWPE